MPSDAIVEGQPQLLRVTAWDYIHGVAGSVQVEGSGPIPKWIEWRGHGADRGWPSIGSVVEVLVDPTRAEARLIARWPAPERVASGGCVVIRLGDRVRIRDCGAYMAQWRGLVGTVRHIDSGGNHISVDFAEGDVLKGCAWEAVSFYAHDMDVITPERVASALARGDSYAPRDALGRPVPEWAREAFELLAKDGRRVAVESGLTATGEADWRIWAPLPGGATYVQHVASHTPIACTVDTLADAARRALAMEAERAEAERLRANVDRSIAACAPSIERALDALNAEATPAPRKLMQPRRHNTTCPRCHGPAYQGAGRVLCEREGGCLADREPETVGYNVSGYDWTTTHDVHGPRYMASHYSRARVSPDEPMFFAEGHGVRTEHPTEAGARTAWREAVLARAKREAGK